MSPHARSRRTVIFLAALVPVILWLMVFRTWMSAPISGQVRDAADGTPVEGAAVLATWTIYGGLEGSPLGIWVMREAVSDERGVFHIPSWGPRVWLRGGFLRRREPVIYFVRRGYRVLVTDNTEFTSTDGGAAPLRIRSILDSQSVQMRRIEEASDYETSAEPLLMHVRGRGLVDQDGCLWSQLPRTIVELQVMRQALLKANKGTALPTLEGWGGDGTCGFAENSLRNAVN